MKHLSSVSLCLLRITKLCVICSFICSLSHHLNAEGSRELAPNGNIMIGASTTTDIAALLIDHNLYNFFASYTNPDPNSRLYIHIADPQTECIYLGFSYGHFNQNGPNPPAVTFEYRIKDPNGNVVFGPIIVDEASTNIQNWSEANTGPEQIYGVGGYNAVQVMSTDLSSAGWSGAGDYYIEFDYPGSGTGLLIDFWDISVTDCTQAPLIEKKGRLWSYNWAIFAINDFGFPVRPFNGAFYVCAPDPDNPEAAFITKIDFNNAGFRPAAFNFAINSYGVSNTGNVMVDRRSVDSLNATQPEYEIFLNDPVDLCITGEVGEVELLGVSRCDAEAYCIKFVASKEGQIDLLLDFDGPDDLYTPGSADLMIAVDVTAGQVGIPSCISWDGLDGLGNSLAEDPGIGIPVVISYAQGIYHFPIYDAEYMINGVQVQAIRPDGPLPLLYYDDSEIAVASGSGEPVMQLTGCTLPCHLWTNFINDDIVGFGNKNTINSWWFSQRIVRSEIFFMPAYLSCSIEGPVSICENETATLALQTFAQPSGPDIPQVIGSAWFGPAIVGADTGASVTIGGGGIYSVEVTWLTALGDTCFSACEVQVGTDPISFGYIDTLILKGETIEINGETFSEGGQYTQTLIAANGCDSILTIDVAILQTVIHFTLDACLSIPTDGSDAVYTEFTPVYPDPISCAAIEAGFVHRDNPAVNSHSCTPGVDDSPAMCVSSLDQCTYDPGNEKSIVFTLTVTPAPDTAVAITGLTFFERAPEMFDWINGPTGPNNYPTLYAVRVIKDGVEIFRAEDVPTTTDWTLESFDFLGLEAFTVDTIATFEFEFLGYCLVGNGAMVPAWDLDEIKVVAGCVSPGHQSGLISGRVLTEFGRKIPDVEISLSEDPAFANPVITMTNQDGAYAIKDVPLRDVYYLGAYKNTDFLKGVSTLDLIGIQRHLLGMKRFESPLQWLAADASGNQVVSVLDIIQLRKLILGLYTELPNNTSWRFGDHHQLLSLSDPWSFDEILEIYRTDLNKGNINLLAVKVGDVNRSISNLQAGVPTRSDRVLHFMMHDEFIRAGETIRINVSASGFSQIAGFQLEMQLKNAEIVDVQSAVLDVTDAYAIHGERLRMSWYDASLATYEPNEILFTILIRSDRAGFVTDMIRLDTEAFPAEAYAGAEPEIIDVNIGTFNNVDQKQESALLQNMPNPFSGETEIRFILEKAGDISLSIYTANGIRVWTQQGFFAAGSHTITVPANELASHGGVLICQLQSDNFVANRRMLRFSK